MPYSLCRHIMPTGSHCNSPALKSQKLCYYHNRVKTITGRPKRPASVRIPFQFPEDRLAVQMNFHVAVQAMVEGKLEPRQLSAITRTYHAAAANLKAGPLVPTRIKHPVERVILSPDEEEVAPAREACHPDEELTHGPDCPCAYCAEKFRNAPGELHHPDCNCGLCHIEEEETHEEKKEVEEEENQHEAGDKNQEHERSEQPAASLTQPQHEGAPSFDGSEATSEGWERANPSSPSRPLSKQSQRDAEIAALYRAAETELAKSAPHNKPAPSSTTIPTLLAAANRPPRRATASSFVAPALADRELHDDEPEAEDSASSYESVLRDYRAGRVERQSPQAAHHAPATGRAKDRVLPEGLRRYNQLMAQIERNKQLAEESWQRYVAAEQAAGRTVEDPLAHRAVLVTNPDGTTTHRYLTWNEEEDRRLDHRRRLLEREQARELAWEQEND